MLVLTCLKLSWSKILLANINLLSPLFFCNYLILVTSYYWNHTHFYSISWGGHSPKHASRKSLSRSTIHIIQSFIWDFLWESSFNKLYQTALYACLTFYEISTKPHVVYNLKGFIQVLLNRIVGVKLFIQLPWKPCKKLIMHQ